VSEEETSPGYYGRGVLKEPAWIWSVPAYFYAGGAAGASAALGEIAELIDRDAYADLGRRCRIVSLTGTAIGSALLIIDLGRPERFLNMLRVFRPSSALNVGSWVLVAAGASTTGALLFPRSKLLALASALAGLPEAGYTAVVLADTAIPIWKGTRRSLPGLFVASSATSAAGLLELMDLDDRSRSAVRRFGLVARVAEAIAAKSFERDAMQVERVGLPLQHGLSGSLWRASQIASLAGLALSFVRRDARSLRVVGGVLSIGGGLAARFAIFYAGFASARDPEATFEQQRADV
jgi:formate-dependent nitrite reductase membrane component NrfD